MTRRNMTRGNLLCAGGLLVAGHESVYSRQISAADTGQRNDTATKLRQDLALAQHNAVNRFAGTLNGTPFSQRKPFSLFPPPRPPSSVRIVSFGGVAVATPDFKTNQPAPVTVMIEARSIPPGTAIELQFFAEKGTSQTVATAPLEGTFELSRAIASLRLPRGRSGTYLNAILEAPKSEEAVSGRESL